MKCSKLHPLLLASLLGLSACGDTEPATTAVGSYSDVAIVADLRVLGAAAAALERGLEREVEYSLKPERVLEADIFDARERRDAAVYKNVIILGLVNGKDGGSRELSRHLGGETLSDQGHKDAFMAMVDNVYAKNQRVMFVAGKEPNLLQSALRKHADVIRERIESNNRQRMRSFLFTDGHEDALEARILAEMNFSMQVPASYHQTRFNVGRGEGVLEVAAVRPTRSVAVFWADESDSGVLERREELLELRRSWGSRFLEEELQDFAGFEWGTEIFKGEAVLTLAGFWEAQVGEYGGPFRTFFLFDERSSRVYGINLLTYAPGMKKHTYMREAHSVAETFIP